MPVNTVVRWVAVGYNPYSPPVTCILWSPNGKTWNYASSGGFDNSSGGSAGRGISYDGSGTWVAVGSEYNQPVIRWSTDGKNWYNVNSGGFGGGGGTYGHDVTYDGTIWVAVGGGSSINNSILWSNDGKNWQDASSGGFGGDGGYGIAYDGNGTWVAVGDGSSVNKSILWSTDGMTWNDSSSGGFPFILAGGGDGTGLHAGGKNGHYGNGIAHDGKGKWVAVGSGTTPTSSILWSNDGKTWHNASSGGFTNNTGYHTGVSVAYDGEGTWVAVGGASDPVATILWSYDGLHWTKEIGRAHV